jgi:hypothetical protein
MHDIEQLADSFKNNLKLEYDDNSVKYVEGFIERVKGQLNKEEEEGLINAITAFIGQCIIVNYGGKWELDKNRNELCIIFDTENMIYPFAKITKQFKNGIEDSVYSFYSVIPTVFKLNI